MDNQLNLTENVDSLFRSLEDFTQKEGIIGKPVTQGNKTIPAGRNQLRWVTAAEMQI